MATISAHGVVRTAAELQGAYDRVTAVMREHRRAVGAWGPDTPEVERARGMWCGLYWFRRESGGIGPFTDGPPTRERLAAEAATAWRVARGEVRTRYTPAEAFGIAQVLDYARGAADTLPGLPGVAGGLAAA